MYAKRAIISSALFFLLIQPAQGQPAESIFSYTLQVASFPDITLARQYAERLSRAGEPVGFGTFELPGRGHWTRVYIGSFTTAGEARDYGNALIARKLITEYLVKTASELQALSRPHTVARNLSAIAFSVPQAADGSAARARQSVSRPAAISASALLNSARPRPAAMVTPPHEVTIRASRPLSHQLRMSEQLAGLLIPLHEALVTLPVANELQLPLAPAMATTAIPRPDPVHLAFNLINESRTRRGGLWVSGDCEEALARLRYIIGDKPDLITLDDNGAVRINHRLLAEAAGANQVAAEEAPVRIAEYIIANEGLLLLVQLSEGAHRYMLHIARRAPSMSGLIDVVGGVNLDNNYDSRINPYRRDGRKLDIERPPKGFDSMVAINPAARWFNLRANEFVSAGQITFHELAEAHAKVVMDLDYLEQDNRPGAHNIALEREERLQAQRPSANLVLTLGSNRLFKSEEEVRHFYIQTNQAAGHQR
jgi:SPOR domain